MIRVYLSNLSPAWPFNRQEAVLDERAPEWRKATVYRDALDPRERKAHNPESLVERWQILRPTNRKGAWTLLLPSLAVFAWDGDDFTDALAALVERKATIRVADGGQEIDPAAVEKARAAFYAGRRRAAVEIRQKAGAAVSAEIRRAATEERLARITKAEWADPAFRTVDLLARTEDESGKPLSYNTVVSRFGGRETAIRNHLAALKRAARREAKKKFSP